MSLFYLIYEFSPFVSARYFLIFFDRKQYFDTNGKGTFSVLQASKDLKRHIKHLIITSSDATISKYPSIGIQKPISEYSLPQDITDWYGYSKILSENLSNRFFVSDKLPVTIIRFAMVWGAGEVLKFNQFYTNHFIPNPILFYFIILFYSVQF